MNFKKILGKSNSGSSSSSRKSLIQSETQIAKLQNEVESLKRYIESLKISVENRDAAIGTLARDKEELYSQYKSAQRTNRNLRQQLIDEREIHTKEKEYLMGEIQRLLKTDESYNNVDRNIILDKSRSICMTYNELKEKDEVICNICEKYLKIKSTKMLIVKKLKSMQLQYQKACETVILLLQKNKSSLDSLLKKLLGSSHISLNSKKHLKLLRINADLYYENTQLKILLSSNCDLNDKSTKWFYENQINEEDKPFPYNFRNNKIRLHTSYIYNNLRKMQDREHTSLNTIVKSLQRCSSDSCLIIL